jgi:hypothetical protein
MFVVAVTGMNNQPCRLVYYHQVCILIYYIQGYILRLNSTVIWLVVKQHLHHIARLNLIIILDRLTVNPYITGVGGILNTVPGRTVHVLRQVFVDANRGLALIYFATPTLPQLF